MSALQLPVEPITAEAKPKPRDSALIRWLRGPADEAAWVRPTFLGIIVLAAILYIVGLNRSGYANAYYSAAVLAATKSWKAFFFGSVDAGNFITVDKPAGALWLMDLSARLFGVNTWSLLLPEALAGVASVALLFQVVRRSFGAVAGLIAALVMALTPVAVVMFRYNNPDALLTLLLIAAAWALLRGIDTGRLRWILLAAFLVGVGFNTKYLQADLVVPAFFLTVLVAAPGSLRRRLLQLVAAGGVLLVSSGWWLVLVDLIPASSRPYIGGSTNNTVLNLVLGYDGLGRVFGMAGPGPGGAGGGGANFGGAAGLWRMFNAQVGGQISWLLPLAFVGLAVGLWRVRRGPRTDRRLAGLLLWGGWLLVSVLIFSFSSGIFHPYYTVQLAPAVAALTAVGLVELWRWQQVSWIARLLLAASVIGTAWWAIQLLSRTPSFVRWLGPLTLGLAVAAGLMLVLPSIVSARGKALKTAVIAAGLIAILAGPAAYSFATVAQTAAGGDPSAGPAGRVTALGPGGTPGSGFRPGGFQPPAGAPAFGAGAPQPGAGRGFGAGRNTVDKALTTFLASHQGKATWLVAVNGANQAASIELATGKPVMAMGGFIGSDPAPTLDQFKALVHAGKLRYIIIGGGVGGGQGGPGGNANDQSISTWVTQNGKAVTVPGSSATLYDLSGAS